jgi:hypothetical protein
MAEDVKCLWEVMGASVRGAAHVRSDLPNQDSLLYWPESGIAQAVILAISDGHGSSKSFRSDQGADIAVKTATEVAHKFLKAEKLPELAPNVPKFSTSSVLRDTAKDKLPKEIVRRWQEAINQELARHPITKEELDKLGNAAQAVRGNQLLAYGATILVVLVAESFILYLQLGDGDILTVSESGEVQRPLPPDERLFANETTSLCSPTAWQDVRVSYQKLSERPPALILVSTDGYSNSFRDELSFQKVATDVFAMIAQPDGVKNVKGNLKDWLSEATKSGSGDDITLGLIYRQAPSVFSSSERGSTSSETDSRLPASLTAFPEDLRAASPAEKLRAIVELYGPASLEDPVRSEGILRDLFPDRIERAILSAALQERAVQALRVVDTANIGERLTHIAGRIRYNAGISPGNAMWVVNVLAAALALVPPEVANAMHASAETAESEVTQTQKSSGWYSLKRLLIVAIVLTLGIGLAMFVRTFQRSRTVWKDGPADFKTLSEAVQKARDKERILVRPGVYREELSISRPIEIAGDGPIEKVIIQSANSKLISDGTVRLSGVTLLIDGGEKAFGRFGIEVQRGELILENCNITTSLAAVGPGVKVTFRHCIFSGGSQVGVVIVDGAKGTIEDSQVYARAANGVLLRPARLYEKRFAALLVDRNGISSAGQKE